MASLLISTSSRRRAIRRAAMRDVLVVIICILSARFDLAEARATANDEVRRMALSSNLFEVRSEPWMFQALKFNESITRTRCDMWSAVFGNTSLYFEEVRSDSLRRLHHYESRGVARAAKPSGRIDIQGRLIFPDKYKLTMQAPYVRVQGELDMYSTKIPI